MRHTTGRWAILGTALGGFVGVLLGKFALGLIFGFFIGIVIGSVKHKATTSGAGRPTGKDAKG